MSTLLRQARFIVFLIGTVLIAQSAHAASVPEFTLALLDGKSVALKDFRGKPVLVNFFHSK